MKNNAIKWILFFACLFFPFSAVASNSSLDEEINIICSKIAQYKDSSDIYFKRDQITRELREELLTLRSSRLFSLPHLDIDTFNACIVSLKRKYYEEKTKAEYDQNLDILLHAWSYLSGVRVFGLKKDHSHYYSNKHLPSCCNLPPSKEDLPQDLVSQLIFYMDKIELQIQKDGQECTVLVPSSLILSSVFYRSNFGQSAMYEDAKENQVFVEEFFSDEIRPLFSKPLPSEGEQDQVRGVVKCVLRLKEGKPCYSLGIIKLFQNTAIYLSAEGNGSFLITGPCSIGSINYLGFQDGILIERMQYQHTINVLDYLFGLQFFHRGLFKEYNELPHLKKVKYHPNYLGVLEEINEELTHLKEDGMRNFGLNFRQYMQPPHILHNTIEKLIKVIDAQQLSIPLIADHRLQNKWFRPDDSVDLPGDIMFDKFSNRISDDRFVEAIRPEPGEILLPVRQLIEHLRCFSYQCIKKLNLSKNYISTEGACEIAQALSKNILPDLEELNLSSNKIGDGALSSFKPLLRRNNFKYLIIHSNYIDVNALDSAFRSSQLFLKVIWAREAWLESGLVNFPQEYEAHKRYYTLTF